MSGKSTPKGGFPEGIDTFHSELHAVFQGSRQKLPRLVSASDIDLDGEGWFKSRPAAEQVQSFSLAQGMWNIDDRLFIQRGGTLYEDDVEIIAGLSDRISICEHWGKIYLTDGSNHWVIDDSSVRRWGLPVPNISVATASGGLESGTYLVQAAFVDAQGSYGGVSDIEAITIISGIRVSVDNVPDTASYLDIYMSPVNQEETTFTAQVKVANLPYTIQDEPTTRGDPPVTAQMTGPISGAAGIFSFRGFLMMWRDNVVFRSEAAEPELFHGENIMQFAGTVTACEGMKPGMWIGTSRGLYWVAGEDPTNWVPDRRTNKPVKKGSAKLDGSEFPEAKTDEPVAFFSADEGLFLGTSDGRLVPLTERKYSIMDGDRVSIAFNERSSGGHKIQQVIVGVI